VNDLNNESASQLPSAPPTEPVVEAAPKTTFADLGLRPEVLKAVSDMGFVEPMEVQSATLPKVRSGRDILVQSRTGSGKTAAFAIPFADWIADPAEKFPQALVLLPTRELALQVAAETARICATTALVVVPVYGGSPMGRQIELLRAGAQVVCGTPGRILDHIRRGTLQLDKIKCVVLDECDEMLSMGFQEDIESILSETPTTRQTLLFSATIPEGIQRLSRRFMREPEILKLSADFVGVHEIRHTYYSIPGGQREAELSRILAFEEPDRAVIFCNTRDETGRVAEHLRRQGLNAEPISSDLSQSEREAVMQRMRAGNIRFLVATDVAARGIDIENLPCVINYTFPESPEIYIHRTGRTGRAGRSGHAISLIGPTEVGSFYYLKLLYKIKPDERSLPSETEVRSRHEGERLAHLRTLLPGDPGAEWHSLARRLMSAIDAERLVGALLRGAFAEPKASARQGVTAVPTATVVPEEKTASVQGTSVESKEPDRRERTAHGERRPRGFGDRERPSRERSRSSTPERQDRDPRRNGPSARPAPAPAPASPSPRKDDTREFWEVWSEEVGRTPTAEPKVTPVLPPAETIVAQPSPAPAVVTAASSNGLVAPGQVRLYVNLGRKDNATPEGIAELLSSSGVAVPAEHVELMNTHSYVNVAEEAAATLCAAMNGRTHGGRTVLCEPARPPKRR
jgi:ATP-dependent RNA helicase DeaD